MNKRVITLLGVGLLIGGLNAQRYVTENFFSSVTKTADVVYGNNYYFIPLQGSPIPPANPGAIPPLGYTPTQGDITADFYAPAGDTETSRPAVIIVHTGNFLPKYRNGSATGDKDDSVNVELANRFARRGFVAISMRYRLGWNPTSASQEVRTGTILNAVYRSIHDVQTMVRFLKLNAATYGVDTNRIALCGIGSGGYVTMAYTTLNKQAETNLPKFQDSNGNSVVNPAYVGDVNGIGGAVNVYNNAGPTNKVAFEMNLGGALGDISWVEGGEPVKVGFHGWKDQFAPYDSGTVIVPTTQEDVVDVHGTRTVVKKFVSLGNNAPIVSFTFNDAVSARGYSMNAKAQAEGLYEFRLPPGLNGNEQGSPWHWWDSATVNASGAIFGWPDIHGSELETNPSMSASHARKYIDTIMWYSVPRMVVAMNLPEQVYVGVDEAPAQSLALDIFPNPSNGDFAVRIKENGTLERIDIYDLSGKLVHSVVSPGQSQVNISRTDLKAGTYVLNARLKDGKTQTGKLVLN
ncbi:MAG: T9SS type A sorting domain-containing protein [Flavobacteriales bacterium]